MYLLYSSRATLCLFVLCCISSVTFLRAETPNEPQLQSLIDVKLLPPPRYDLGGVLAILPNSELITLRASINDPLPKLYRVNLLEAKLYWQTDHGTLYEDHSAMQRLDNLWAPPASSETSTITITYEAKYTTVSSKPAQFVVRKSASLKILSPTSPAEFRNGYINGYNIGEYPNPFDPNIFQRLNVEESNYPREHPEKYAPPSVFYKITKENIELLVSPHLKLRFFTIDFPWKSLGMPQYIALDLHLIQKLEDLLALLRESNLKVTTFKPIYGFRPPSFNLGTIQTHSFNLKAPFSMHQFGKAVDLIVDEDGNDVIDDLNGDGRIDMYDPAELVKYVNVLDRRYVREGKMDSVGGAGIYKEHDFLERPKQSPYLHIDVRGFLNDAGNPVRWPAAYPNGDVIPWAKLMPAQLNP